MKKIPAKEVAEMVKLFRKRGHERDEKTEKFIGELQKLPVGEGILISESEAKKYWREQLSNAISHLTARRPEVGHFRVGGITGKGWLIVKLADKRTTQHAKETINGRN